MTSILKVTEIQDPTNSNKALEIDSTGRVLQPQRPYILATPNADTTYSAAAVITDLAVRESRGITHSSGVFTVPRGGLYQIHLSLIAYDNGAGIYWRKNGTSQWRIGYSENSTDALWNNIGGSIVTELDASDTISFVVQSSTRIYGHATDPNTVGQIHLLFLG